MAAADERTAAAVDHEWKHQKEAVEQHHQPEQAIGERLGQVLVECFPFQVVDEEEMDDELEGYEGDDDGYGDVEVLDVRLDEHVRENDQ